MTSKIWEAKERTGLGISAGGESVERYLSARLDPFDKTNKNVFDLYYFINQTPGAGGVIKTVLFCSGGPGELVQPGDDNFVEFFLNKPTAYQVVHFHLRGSGLSQLPPSNAYDKYLRTQYAVEDIESVRKEVLGSKPWDGIVGYSYGTILAQQYAAEYGKKAVRKLILMGPISMHMFKSHRTATAIFDEYQQKVTEIRETVLRTILNNDEMFSKLTASDKSDVIAKLTDVYASIERYFGSERFIAENYQNLKRDGKLTKAGLVDSKKRPYKQLFFNELRELRNLGWRDGVDETQKKQRRQLAKTIAVTLIPRLEKLLGSVKPRDLIPRLKPDRCDRTVYVMRGFDGFHSRFLKEYLDAKSRDVRKALKAMTGELGMNHIVERVGITNEKVKIWDPADYKHAVPTLILKGDSDPVSANGQAERYRDHALTGEKLLIEFNGVGHGFDLPRIMISEPFLAGTVSIKPGRIPPKKTKLVSWKIPTSASIEIKGRTRGLTFQNAIIGKDREVWIEAFNNTLTTISRPAIAFTIQHSMIRESVLLTDVRVPPKSATWIEGRIVNEVDREWYELKKPIALEEGLFPPPLSRLDYKTPDDISGDFENRLSHPVVGKRRSWIWRPKVGAPFEGICQGRSLSSRDCLIYAFFELDFEDFTSQDSPLLKKIRKFANHREIDR